MSKGVRVSDQSCIVVELMTSINRHLSAPTQPRDIPKSTNRVKALHALTRQ